MKVSELLDRVRTTIEEHPDAAPNSIDDLIILSIPEPKRHNGYRVRLFGSTGPYATIINGSRDKLTVRVSARELLLCLDGVAHGDSNDGA